MDLSTVIAFLSIFIATASFVITILNFNRQKKIDNENQVYNLKINLYNSITTRFSRLISSYEMAANDSNITDSIGRETMVNKIDREGIEFANFISENSLLLPDKMINALEAFIENTIYLEDARITTIDAGLQKMYAESLKIINLFRNDLNIESVNKSLHIRTR